LPRHAPLGSTAYRLHIPRPINSLLLFMIFLRVHYVIDVQSARVFPFTGLIFETLKAFIFPPSPVSSLRLLWPDYRPSDLLYDCIDAVRTSLRGSHLSCAQPPPNHPLHCTRFLAGFYILVSSGFPVMPVRARDPPEPSQLIRVL